MRLGKLIITSFIILTLYFNLGMSQTDLPDISELNLKLDQLNNAVKKISTNNEFYKDNLDNINTKIENLSDEIAFMKKNGSLIDQKFKDILSAKFDISNSYWNLVATTGTIFLAFLAIISAGTYLILSERIEKKVLKSTEVQHTKIYSQIYNGQGYTYWLNYQMTKDPRHLAFAINVTMNAYKECIRKLTEEDRDFEEINCRIQNNLAYYLAERGNDADREFVRSLIAYVKDKIAKFPSQAENWRDTIDFVNQRYNLDDQTK